MATTVTNPAETKPTFKLAVRYKSKDGSWKTAESERDFSVPESVGEISVNVVDADGKTQRQVKREFERITFGNIDDFLRFVSDNPLFAMQGFMYGADLYFRNVIKAPIAAEEEGPGKTIQKMAADIVAGRAKLGKTITMERALELARLSLEEE